MNNQEVIDLTEMDKDEICHIKCHQRKELQHQLTQKDKQIELLLECVEFYGSARKINMEIQHHGQTGDTNYYFTPIEDNGKKAKETLEKYKEMTR